MLLQADAKQLEWVGATYLSQDKTALDEIWASVDQHADNQERFGLPSRLIAKTFVFRLIYGGSSYSYANDPNFRDIGNETFWQNVIDEFYKKYSGLKQWHDKIMEDAKRDRKLVMPTGRVYAYEPDIRFGRAEWPRTKILNYPVQGLGADLMAIARVSLRNRLLNLKLRTRTIDLSLPNKSNKRKNHLGHHFGFAFLSIAKISGLITSPTSLLSEM